ncbi:hypothetical protein [Litorisediminicola beolgyonensis]|uniref:Lysozyme inhibitor LprI N-terminal domain-containing protein n=1 Tax=Litorisediminicola beolgyonensis TaxID=1173614 RepID=A0ABW3ZNK3_9RHOB
MTGVLKTSLAVLALLAGPCAAVADGPDTRADRQAYIFADCAGRLRAHLEHGWLDGTHDAGTEAQGLAFDDVLDALPHAVPGPLLLDHRLRAKAHQAHLLQLAAFHLDPERRRLARVHADRLRAGCTGLLLS